MQRSMAICRRFFILILMVLSLGCAEQKQTHTLAQGTPDDGIVGGELVEKTSAEGKLTVLIYGSYQETVPSGTGEMTPEDRISICTGSFITENVILTAAHCLFKKPYETKIMYTNDMNDRQAQSSEVDRVLSHPQYKGESGLNQAHLDDDLALIKIKGTKPADYRVLSLGEVAKDENPFDIIAMGFGRTTGVDPENDSDAQGMGVLRKTEARAKSFDPQKNFFVVDQTGGHGVCEGDSGGPAILKVDETYYAIGIAKAIFRADGKSISGPKIDGCQFQSAYLNIQYYLPWISAALADFQANP